MSKPLSSSAIELLNKMSKLCRDGLTPKEAQDWMLTCEPNWECSFGKSPSKGQIINIRKRIEQKQKMMKQVNNGVTIFVNGKPQK